MARPIKKTAEDTLQDRKLAVLRGQLQAIVTKMSKVDLAREMILSEPWKRYKLKNVNVKATEDNSAVYLIADVHFRNHRLDTNHTLQMFQTIQNDINKHNYKNITICMLGDDIEGLIHRSTNNTKAVIPFRDYINIVIECLNQIKNLKNVYYVDKGNHTQTRPGETEANQLPDEDLGIFAADTLKYGLRPDIHYEHGEIVYFEHLDKIIALYHGNQKWASKGKNEIINKLMAKNTIKKHVFPDISISGHFHKWMDDQVFGHKRMVSCPAAKHWEGDYENNMNFYSSNQVTRLTFEYGTPCFLPIEIKDK